MTSIPNHTTDSTHDSGQSDTLACCCQSGTAYVSCCRPYHLGTQPAPTALALMRSRYSAYALGLADYILNTTHRENVQFHRNFKAWRREVAEYCHNTQFLGLTIFDSANLSEHSATVTFQAILSQQGKPYQLNEKSLFFKVGARWLYHSGASYEEGDAEPRTTVEETDALPRHEG